MHKQWAARLLLHRQPRLVKGNYGEELYESIYGPTWYSFDVGNVHYVVTPIDHGDNPTDYTQRDYTTG